MPALALYQPDIPQNTGAAMRLCACLGAELHVIGPTAYPWKEEIFRRSALDYGQHLKLVKHDSWEKFLAATQGQRKILIETDGAVSYETIAYQQTDILIMGAESKGFPHSLFGVCDLTAHIPMVQGVRSMNVVTAAAIALGEVMRQRRNT